MKTKRRLAVLLVMIMVLSVAGTLAGCGGKDAATDPTPEVQQEKEAGKPEVENPKQEATATPEPTATPEVMPTAEELMQANEDMFDDKMKMTMSFAYSGPTELGNMALDMEAVISYYDNIEHQVDKATVSMMGVTETSNQEVYYVDDEASGLRTEYLYDSEVGKWIKSQYAYYEMEEDEEEESPLKNMVNPKVTKDDMFYYLTGELSEENASELSDIMDISGTDATSVLCTMKFERETKKIVSAEVVVKMDVQETAEGSANADDFVVSVERLTTPIVIPEEVLAAESDGEVDIDWEVIPGEEDEDDALPEPEKYAQSEMPEAWGGWYDEYNCKSGTFMMWDDDLNDTIPVTVYAKENWYFDNQYKYTLYLAVDDPAVSANSPAHEVDYEDSDVAVEETEEAKEELLERDYEGTKTVEDVVSFVCDEKQCFYLESEGYEYIRRFFVLQDIGLDNYVEISILTSDLTTEPLTLIQKFLLDIE